MDGKPYSEDLRNRIIEVINDGATIAEAAEQLGVSVSSVVRILRLYRETGSVSPAKFGGYREFALAAYEERIRQWVAQQPDITLAELEARLAKKKVNVGKSSIWRFLRHLELPLKKACGRPSKIEKTSPPRVNGCESSSRSLTRKSLY